MPIPVIAAYMQTRTLLLTDSFTSVCWTHQGGQQFFILAVNVSVVERTNTLQKITDNWQGCSTDTAINYYHKVVHGASTWYGFRFILGLYVDIRVLKFCLKFKHRNEARSKQEFIRNYNIFNIVKEESVVGSQEVEKRLKEGGFEKY